MTKTIVLTEEQENVVQSAINGFNIIVDAVAGSGKTTMLLHGVAKRLRHKRILLLTYSSNLKNDNRIKASQLNLSLLKVHSFHSTQQAPNDKKYKKALHDLAIFLCEQFETIIADEMQDCTPLHFRLLVSIIQYQHKKPQLILVGDKWQTIFQYQGSDARYLLKAKEILGPLCKESPWVVHKLTKTFRVPSNITHFVNNYMLGSNRLIPNIEGGNIEYHVLNPWEVSADMISIKIIDTINSGKHFDDIMILVTSVSNLKHTHPISCLQRELRNNNIPVYIRQDENEPDPRLMVGKVRILTIHQSKGLEADIVFVLGFDSGYMNMRIHKYLDPTVCPETLYVAVTRAKEKVVLFQSNKNYPLSFIQLNMDLHYKIYCDNIDCNQIRKILNDQIKFNVVTSQKEYDDNSNLPIAMTKICKRIHEDLIDDLLSMADISHTPGKLNRINISFIIETSKQRKTCEFVGDINGYIIPLMWHSVKQHELNLEDIQEYIEHAISYRDKKEGLTLRQYQIPKHKRNWLTLKQIKDCFQRLDMFIGPPDNSIAECEILDKKGVFSGYADFIKDGKLYEIKCLSGDIDSRHILQTCAYLCYDIKDYTGKPITEAICINILSGEMYIITMDPYKREEFKELLQQYASTVNVVDKVDDNQFLINAKRIIDEQKNMLNGKMV